jgi:hypothetical protein
VLSGCPQSQSSIAVNASTGGPQYATDNDASVEDVQLGELEPELGVYTEADDAADRDAAVQPDPQTDQQCAPQLCETGSALPGDQRFDADGSCARSVATGQGKLQQLAFANNGYLFGIKDNGDIYRYVDVNCNGSFDDNEVEQFAWASSGGRGDDLTFDVGYSYLYATSPDGVVRWLYCGDTFAGGTALPVVVGQPTANGHSALRLDADFLYVQWTPEPGASESAAVTKRFALSGLQPAQPLEPAPVLSWADGEVYAPTAADGVDFGETHEELPSWSWQRESSDVQVLGAATSPLDAALYVTLADGDGSIYRIATSER